MLLKWRLHFNGDSGCYLGFMSTSEYMLRFIVDIETQDAKRSLHSKFDMNPSLYLKSHVIIATYILILLYMYIQYRSKRFHSFFLLLV